MLCSFFGNSDAEFELEEQEFESSDEENNINVVELRSEDETKADVI